MPAFLSYSGRGRGNRGRGLQAGRGRGRGRRTSTTYIGSGIDGDTVNGRTIRKSNKWVRVTGSLEEQGAKRSAVSEFHEPDQESEKNAVKSTSDDDIAISPNGTWSELVSSKPKDKDISTVPTYSHAIMKKNGQNQLVLLSKTKTRSVLPASVSTVSSGGDEKEESAQDHKEEAISQSRNLAREGKHKLVSITAANTKKVAEARRHSLKSYYKHKNPHPRKFSAPPAACASPVAKRVKLSLVRAEKEDEEDMDESSSKKKSCEDVGVNPKPLPESQTTLRHTKDIDHEDSNSRAVEKLTDFAYRETSRVRQLPIIPRHNLHWSKKDSNESSTIPRSSVSPSKVTCVDANLSRYPLKKNMGLVRVQPDEKRTPICPTFLKGLQCQDQYCRKRHDIPKEYAMPVCSFFQRHGQCLRGEACVFRHIKVNPKAVVCPSFAVLGFCGDEECTMQHVRARKGETNHSNVDITKPKAKEGVKLRGRSKSKNVYYRNKTTK